MIIKTIVTIQVLRKIEPQRREERKDKAFF